MQVSPVFPIGAPAGTTLGKAEKATKDKRSSLFGLFVSGEKRMF